MADSQLRARLGKTKGKPTRTDSETLLKQHKYTSTYATETDAQGKKGRIALAILTALAFFTRFYKLDHPNEVVFDEVHFGKFASYYLQRTYFFDVHPPFAKILFAFAGWLIGYDGHFLFDNIGDSYIDHKVPYVGLRSLPALLGALTVPLVFLIMRDSGYGLVACIVSSSMILFDNAQLAEQRLILLDATLVFSMALAVWTYVRFYRLRHQPFSKSWWQWLLATGVALSCVMSTKYVGLFTYITIGGAVAVDLWNLLDYKRGLSIERFGQHFIARFVSLIVIPFVIYLFWFWLHFAILTRSGPGDDFMSPAFQATLADNPMTALSRDIHYYDTITIMHKDTKAYLHSHTARYPLRYDDGRISSQGQQVTGYPFNDTNNNWIILPPQQEDVKISRPVKNKDVIKLHHIATNSDLLTHDVASPHYPTNQEFTTVDLEKSWGERYNDTLFTVEIEHATDDTVWRTRAGLFKLVHVPTRVAMWTHTKVLPEWGFQQQEINGNKNILQTSNIWYVEDIIDLQDEARLKIEPKKIERMPFFFKYLELQRAMFYHNNALTSSHPYASQPISWPFLLRGVSFWTKGDDIRQQIYFLGNPIGWWIAVGSLAVLTGILSADQLTRRRGIETIEEPVRFRLYNSVGYFFFAWAAHYFPFYLMGRQLFLHHYLPAHLASCLVTGALTQFLFSRGFDGPVSPGVVVPGSRVLQPKTPTSPKVGIQKNDHDQTLLRIVGSIIVGAVLVGFLWFAPITYGYPGCSVEMVQRMKWLDSWDFHFLK